jgi:hydrogenase expression/formation protein HypE
MLGIINEIFENSALSAKLYSENFPVSKAAGAIAKLLGIDPGFAACEGCLTAIVACDFADACIQALQKLPGGAEAAIVGEVISGDGTVMLCSNWGAMRKLVVPDGDQLPRIC